jgi:hypothetical protein
MTTFKTTNLNGMHYGNTSNQFLIQDVPHSILTTFFQLLNICKNNFLYEGLSCPLCNQEKESLVHLSICPAIQHSTTVESIREHHNPEGCKTYQETPQKTTLLSSS